MIRATDRQIDNKKLDLNKVRRDNKSHIEELRKCLVGTKCIQAGELKDGDGSLVLEFENYILVFAGLFFIESSSGITQKPNVQ